MGVTGICSRTSCPLANSRYATIRPSREGIKLHMKVVERAHTPKELWEKIKLPNDEKEAISEIEKQLKFWPNVIIERCKKRYLRMKEYLKQIEKLKEKNRPLLVGVKKKIERREKRREYKAKIAAKITENIKKELIERLKTNVYDEEIVNIPANEYELALDEMGQPETAFVADFESEQDIEDMNEIFRYNESQITEEKEKILEK